MAKILSTVPRDFDDKSADAVAVALDAPADALTSRTTTETVAVDRMQTLVKELTSGSLHQLTEARDKIDNLMMAIEKRAQQQVASVGEFAAFVTQSLEMAGVIMTPIDDLAKTVAASTDAKQSTVLTQR